MTKQEIDQLHEKIDRGVKRGVRKALRKSKAAGLPIHVWCDGKIVEIPANEIVIDDDAENDPAKRA